MEIGTPRATIAGVRDPNRIKRYYTLVPRSSPNGQPDGVRRFRLARLGTTPRSALEREGRDRLERMEQIVEAERDRRDRRPPDRERPSRRPSQAPADDQDKRS